MRRIRVFHRLQQAHSALFRAADKRLRDVAGITASQNTVLFVLTAKDGLPISDIAAQLRMGKSSLTALVDRMVLQGYVRRERNNGDARIQNIFIEDKGKAVVQQTLSGVQRINERLLEPFNDSERAVIERFLSHVATRAGDIVGGPNDEEGQDRVSQTERLK